MRKVNYRQGKWWNVVFFLTALLIAAADQVIKLWIRSNLAIGVSLPEVGFFRITHIHNTGAAFGLFQGQSFALIMVSFVGVVVILVYVLFFYRRFPLPNNTLGRIALGLILGGTVGNLIDRLYFGYVIDFIYVGNWWPAFNIADSAVVVGVIILAYSLLGLARAEEH